MYGWWIFWPLLIVILFWWGSSTVWWPGAYRWRRGDGVNGQWGYDERTGTPYRGLWSSRGRHGYRGKGPAGYRRSDEHIAEDVNDALMMSDEIDATGVVVGVQGGVVSLSGYVSSRPEKRLAELLADAVPGVTDVKNELRIGAVPPSPTAAGPIEPRENSPHSIEHRPA